MTLNKDFCYFCGKKGILVKEFVGGDPSCFDPPQYEFVHRSCYWEKVLIPIILSLILGLGIFFIFSSEKIGWIVRIILISVELLLFGYFLYNTNHDFRQERISEKK
jgi:hypothetical protein